MSSNSKSTPTKGPASIRVSALRRSPGQLQTGPAAQPSSVVSAPNAGAEPLAEGAIERGERGPPNPPPPLSPPLSPPIDEPASASPPALDPADEADDVYTPAPRSNPVVDALKEAGLHLKALGDGNHGVTCPWAAEHHSGGSQQSVYVEPSTTNPVGQFRCDHAHTERKDAASLIHHLGLTTAEARAKPRIRVSPGELHLAAAAAERVLAADGTYFHAGGPIVRVVDRPGMGIASEQVNDQTLSGVLSSKIDWERRGKGTDWIRCDPPAHVVQNLLRGQDRPHLPALAGLARQPFFGPDHLLITSPGYHAETGMYAAFNSADYKLNEPTRSLAEHWLAYLNSLIDEFAFDSESDRSAALAAMLTAAIRPSLPQAPAFSITATRSGSGKSYLAKIVTLMAGPAEPHNMSYPATAEEATKVVLAALLEKPAVILFDDMQTDWKSFGALNKALTSATTTERLLGSSRTATARTNVLFLGTGNNIEPQQDMRRRVVSIRLTPGGTSPALRRFEHEPVGYIRAHRARVVGAALGIIGAFQAAGSPQTDVKSVGTFGEWSNLCRQPLLWLGEPDPAKSLIEQVTNDSDQQALEELLDIWWRHFGGHPMTVRKVIAAAEKEADLKDILEELPVRDGRYVNHNKLGWYLKKNLGRWAGGLRIERGEDSDRRTWRVLAS